MNKYGVSVKLKVVPIDKAERESMKAMAQLYEQVLEWQDDELIKNFTERANGHV